MSKLVAYRSWAVFRNGKCVGLIPSAPNKKAKDWAIEVYGDDATVECDHGEIAKVGMDWRTFDHKRRMGVQDG